MLFNVLVLAAVLGIAYYHYAQGFFSATISAVIAVIAAILAVSLHEPIVTSLLKGAAADYAGGLVMLAVFALTYIILRTIFDKAVPGNIRLPVAVDRVGGAAVGLIAGIFAVGVFALAAQSFPFGPSIGMYSRYKLGDNREISVMVPTQQRSQDMVVADQMAEDRFDTGSKKGLWIPVDDMLLGAVGHLSDGGSVAGDRTLKSIHPDYADEMFGQRLGIQVGAKHSALELPGLEHVSIPKPGLFTPTQDFTKPQNQADAEMNAMHERPVVAKPEGGEDFPLVVRVMFGKDAADSDGYTRFSPGSIRLVANGKNYWPYGTIQNGTKLYANRLDDFLLVKSQDKDRGADLLFFVDANDVVSGDAKTKDYKIKDGVFIEIKRLARIDLTGQAVAIGIPPSKDVDVLRKPAVVKDADKKEGGAGSESAAGGPAAAAASGPFVVKDAKIDKKLFSPINTGIGEKDVKNAQIQSGSLSMQSRQFTQLDIMPVQSLTILKQGSNTVDELFEPVGYKLVQVEGTPPAEGGDAWAWADNFAKFALVDAAGKAYGPAGAFAKVKKEQADRMLAVYNTAATPSVKRDEGRPMNVWIAFLVPSGTHLKSFTYEGKPLKDVDQQVP